MARVLVVDDNDAIRETMKAALEDDGHEVLAAVDGESLDIALREQPDLVFLDINMPGMDGIEVSQRLKGDSATAHIPIIAMSARQAHDRGDGRRRVQADGWLDKPFDLDHLSRAVARWAS